VRQARLKNLDGALDAYRQALAIDVSHAPSRAALEGLLADEGARREAAAIVRPLYEAEGEHARLLRVLDIEAEFADSPADKLALYAQATSVAEGPLADAERAFAYAARGLKESAQDLELPSWLERVERLTEKTRNYRELVELLRSVIPDILDADQQLDVTLRVAVLARTKLEDKELARASYQKALELRSDDTRALQALESLYEESGDSKSLLDVLRRRVEVAESDADRQALLFKEARLSDKDLGDPTSAILAYERILETSLDERALVALERLYSDTKRYDDLIALFERQIGFEGVLPSRKAALHHALGVVLEKKLADIDRAFDQYEAALRIEPQHEGTIASLEGLMAEPEHAAKAAEMLEGVYLLRLDWRRVMSTLEARLVSSQDPDARRILLRRLAKLHEEQEEDYKAALETTAKLLAEDVTDSSTWSELERLARVANAEGRLAEISRRCKRTRWPQFVWPSAPGSSSRDRRTSIAPSCSTGARTRSRRGTTTARSKPSIACSVRRTAPPTASSSTRRRSIIAATPASGSPFFIRLHFSKKPSSTTTIGRSRRTARHSRWMTRILTRSRPCRGSTRVERGSAISPT